MTIRQGKATLIGDVDERDLYVVLLRRSKLKKDFFLAMGDGIMFLYSLDLTKHEYRVMLFLLSHMEFDNFCYNTQVYIADKLKVAQPDISKTLKSLELKGLIFREKTDRGKVIRVSAVIAWRGRTGKEFEKRYAMDSEHIVDIRKTVG
jgi:DNA-binding MarR family transcriptional regulator